MSNFRYIDKDALHKDPFELEEEEKSEFERLLEETTFQIPDLERYGARGHAVSSKGLGEREILRQGYETQAPIEAKVTQAIKGGFEAMVGATQRCFVPLGQMELGPLQDLESYVNKTFRFIVIEYKNRNVVLSRKLVLQEEQELMRTETLKALDLGQIHEGQVTRLSPSGAVVNIKGVEGFIPRGELSWEHLRKVEDAVQIGDKVNVKILKISNTPRFSMLLSLKTAGETHENLRKIKEALNFSTTQHSQPEEVSVVAAAFERARKK
jgi:ribosomal protein S1